MKIKIKNSQKHLKISKQLVAAQANAILSKEKIDCDEVIIYFVDDKKISKIHKKLFNNPSATDTISIPYDRPSDRSLGYCFLGEVFISTETAKKYAAEHDICPHLEATLYMIHGLLHLVGYDDISSKDRIIMRKKEKSCMNLLKRLQLITVKK